jgi:hypothetical protein
MAKNKKVAKKEGWITVGRALFGAKTTLQAVVD